MMMKECEIKHETMIFDVFLVFLFFADGFLSV